VVPTSLNLGLFHHGHRRNLLIDKSSKNPSHLVHASFSQG
jgi:hypothetical protein